MLSDIIIAVIISLSVTISGILILNKKSGGTFRDLFSKKYKDYNPDFEWYYLSHIDYISIVRVFSSKFSMLPFPDRSINAENKTSSKLYKLTLVIDAKSKKRVTVFKDNDKYKVFEKAQEIKDFFKCSIYDCSSHRKKWIK